MAYGDEQASANPIMRFGSIALGAGIYLLGGFIPLILIFVALFALKKVFPRLSESALLFSGLATGQFLWFLAGAVIVPGSWLAVAPDLAVGGLLIVWFVARPSLVPAVLIIVFEIAGLAMNSWTFADTGFADAAGKILVLHILLRVAIAGAGVWFLVKRNEVPAAVEAFE